MKILVTGGAGFIGSHVCERLLSDGYRVVSIDDFNDFYDPAVKKRNLAEIRRHPRARNFKSFKGDIRNWKQIDKLFRSEKPDLVVHLAAMAGVRPSFKNPALYTAVNVCGTQVLLQACVQNHVRGFVFGSSSSVYGNNKKVPFSESDNADRPISPYAVTKRTAEMLCGAYARRFGLAVCVLRFFTAYGPRQRPDLAIHKFTRLIFEGRPIPFYGDGRTKRDYTYIDDIVDGVARAVVWTARARKRPRVETFNLGESRAVSLGQLVGCLEKAIGKKTRLHKMPMQAGDVRRTFADVSKAKKVLGYLPSTDFEEGIRYFVDWYRKTHEKNRAGSVQR